MEACRKAKTALKCQSNAQAIRADCLLIEAAHARTMGGVNRPKQCLTSLGHGEYCIMNCIPPCKVVGVLSDTLLFI